eukprot:5437456-Amphidinium_carterae.1
MKLFMGCNGGVSNMDVTLRVDVLTVVFSCKTMSRRVVWLFLATGIKTTVASMIASDIQQS